MNSQIRHTPDIFSIYTRRVSQTASALCELGPDMADKILVSKSIHDGGHGERPSSWLRSSGRPCACIGYCSRCRHWAHPHLSILPSVGFTPTQANAFTRNREATDGSICNGCTRKLRIPDPHSHIAPWIRPRRTPIYTEFGGPGKNKKWQTWWTKCQDFLQYASQIVYWRKLPGASVPTILSNNWTLHPYRPMIEISVSA